MIRTSPILLTFMAFVRSQQLSLAFVGALVFLVVPYAASAAAASSGPIPADFFGLHLHKPVVIRQPWPTIPFTSGRLWDSGVAWSEANPAKGVYDWELLDKWFAKYHEHDMDELLYTFGRVPQWASSKPNDDECSFKGRGQCDPPDDLKPDGTGTNQHWKDFVSAIATHSKNSHGAHIRYWEIWNEANMEHQWTGTNAQLLRMAKDARDIIRGIDPDAVILTPSSPMKPPRAEKWMESYLRDGGGDYADVIAFHGYIHTGRQGVYPVAADILPAVSALRGMMEAHGQGSKPIFDTEASWGSAEGMGFKGDEDFEAGFLAQFYLLHWSAGVSRFYWYAWNNDRFGTLWSPDSDDATRPGQMHKAAVAYRQIVDWMVGATMQPLCSGDGHGVWTCGLSRPNGYEALVVWSVRGNQSYKSDARFKKMRDLEGHQRPLSGGNIDIGFSPVILENK